MKVFAVNFGGKLKALCASPSRAARFTEDWLKDAITTSRTKEHQTECDALAVLVVGGHHELAVSLYNLLAQLRNKPEAVMTIEEKDVLE